MNLIMGCFMWFLSGCLVSEIKYGENGKTRHQMALVLVCDVIMAIWNIYLAVR